MNTFKVALKTLYLFDSSWLNCCRDSVTLVNRMVDARPCNIIDMLRRVRNRRTIIITIIIIIINVLLLTFYTQMLGKLEAGQSQRLARPAAPLAAC